jgi:hypothetical protein
MFAEIFAFQEVQAISVFSMAFSAFAETRTLISTEKHLNLSVTKTVDQVQLTNGINAAVAGGTLFTASITLTVVWVLNQNSIFMIQTNLVASAKGAKTELCQFQLELSRPTTRSPNAPHSAKVMDTPTLESQWTGAGVDLIMPNTDVISIQAADLVMLPVPVETTDSTTFSKYSTRESLHPLHFHKSHTTM